MTTLTLATCPRCGSTPSVFIRAHDDLVCKVCRGEPNRSQPLHTPRYLAPATVRREGAMRLSAPSWRSWGRIY